MLYVAGGVVILITFHPVPWTTSLLVGLPHATQGKLIHKHLPLHRLPQEGLRWAHMCQASVRSRSPPCCHPPRRALHVEATPVIAGAPALFHKEVTIYTKISHTAFAQTAGFITLEGVRFHCGNKPGCKLTQSSSFAKNLVKKIEQVSLQALMHLRCLPVYESSSSGLQQDTGSRTGLHSSFSNSVSPKVLPEAGNVTPLVRRGLCITSRALQPCSAVLVFSRKQDEFSLEWEICQDW